jgi:hypothetical protein
LLAQSFHGGYNSGRDLSDRPVSVYFSESSLLPVMLHNRRGEGRVSAHALLENLFRVIGSLGKHRTL